MPRLYSDVNELDQRCCTLLWSRGDEAGNLASEWDYGGSRASIIDDTMGFGIGAPGVFGRLGGRVMGVQRGLDEWVLQGAAYCTSSNMVRKDRHDG